MTIGLLVWEGWCSTTIGQKLITGILIPAIVLWFWGRWMAPRSPLRWPEGYRFIAEVVLFGSVVMVTVMTGHPRLAVTYGILAALSIALTHGVR
jgi:hypothetical protein